MTNYKEFLKAHQHKEHIAFQRQPDGSVKYYTFHGLKYTQRKFEIKPRGTVLYYSRYVTDPFAYKEFNINFFISSQMRSLNHHIIKEL